MRYIVLLSLWAVAAHSFADFRGYFGSGGEYQLEQWFPSMAQAQAMLGEESCVDNADPEGYSQVYSYAGGTGEFTSTTMGYDCTDASARTELSAYTIEVYQCTDPTATLVEGAPWEIACTGGDYALTTEDIQTLVGYLIGSFGIGFALGYLQRAFYKAVEKL